MTAVPDTVRVVRFLGHQPALQLDGEWLAMNRSLEALAIFAVCLAGILAVVRFSTQADTTGPRSVAGRTKAPTIPAQGTSSAADRREDVQPDVVDPVEPPLNSLAHEQGCGLDKSEGKVYPPLSPLLTQQQIAERTIRSAPWRMYVLPDADSAADELATGYDEEYDAAMADMLSGSSTSDELSERQQVEAEYAAAELAAAREATEPKLEAQWLVKNLLAMRDSSLQHLQQWLTGYADPALRAFSNKTSISRWPLLFQSPRAKRQARQPLLDGQRAESDSRRVSWDDYLSFAERHLSHPVDTSQTAQ
jgi:hypothetical protein